MRVDNRQRNHHHRTGAISYWMHWVLATGMLVGSGVLYRHFEPKWRGTGTDPIRLPVKLEKFPLAIDPWQGEKRAIPETTENYMKRNFADDYFNHLYSNKQRRGVWAALYVVYCSSRPAAIEGHNPKVCYPGAGWNYDGGEVSHITTRSGKTIPCIVHRLHMPKLDYKEIVILSFYVVNGEIFTSEDSFSSFMGRKPNISGDPAQYVAQVQVSSAVESSVRAAAVDLVDTVLQYLPDKEGKVAVAPDYDPNASTSNINEAAAKDER